MSKSKKSKKQETMNYDEIVVPIALGLAFLIGGTVAGFAVTFWITFGLLIPAAALLGAGTSNYLNQRQKMAPLKPAPNDSERELLSAIREGGGSITPAEAAMETSLTVKEADRMLSELASGGHLAVESDGGSLVYSLRQRRDREIE